MATSARTETTTWWNTVDFREAPPGWRVVSLWQGKRVVHHVAGWLIQDRYELDADADKVVDTPDEMGRERRVIPGICAEGYGWAVVAIDENLQGGGEENWVVLAPGEAEPTAEAQEVEVRRRAETAAKKAQA